MNGSRDVPYFLKDFFIEGPALKFKGSFKGLEKKHFSKYFIKF